MVTTQVGESVVEKIVYRNCPLMLPNRNTHDEFVELDMVDFDVIFGNGLVACFFFLLPLIVGQHLLSLTFLMNPS